MYIGFFVGLALAVVLGCKTEDSHLNDAYSEDIPNVPGEVELKEVCIDGRDFKADADPVLAFHKKLALLAGFPEYYGNNWDALDEILADHFGDFSLTVLYSDTLKAAFGDDQYKMMSEVFETAAARSDAKFEYTLVTDKPADEASATADVATSASLSCE